MQTPQQIIYESRNWKALEKLGTNFTPTRKQGAWTYYD